MRILLAAIFCLWIALNGAWAQNAIVVENQLPGTPQSQWDLSSPSNENHIPFIVRADELTSDILFQTSDTTWQAYNGWGGANIYGGNGPGGDSGPGRAYKVSYNRPIGTRDGVGTYAGWQSFLFGAEYAAIYWL